MTEPIDLPASDDNFWLDGEKELIQERDPQNCDHDFEQVDRINIVCIKCNMGLRLDYLDEFKDKHLYRNNELII